MPRSHEYKIIFVHIPKTGGTSIEKALGIYQNRDCLHGLQRQHFTIPELVKKELLTTEEIEAYFKFTVIRNPWDRCVSEYFSSRRIWKLFPTFRLFLHNHLVPLINKFFPKGEYTFLTFPATHFSPQYRYVFDEHGKQVVDYVARFENLKEEWEKICDTIGCKLDLPHAKKTNHNHYSFYYDEETKDLIRNLYVEDVEVFEYEFEDMR